jgi:hypothetical protein
MPLFGPTDSAGRPPSASGPLGSLATPVAALLKHQDLNDSDEDVDGVEFEGQAFTDRVGLDAALGRHARVCKDLLDVVEDHAGEDGETAVKRDGLGDGERAERSPGENLWTAGRSAQVLGQEGRRGPRSERGTHHRSERREGDDSETGEERTAEVEVLVRLSRGTDEGERANGAHRVEASAGEEKKSGARAIDCEAWKSVKKAIFWTWLLGSVARTP